MIIIVVVFYLILFIKDKKENHYLEILGIFISKYLKLKVKNYQIIRYLEFMKTKKELNVDKNKFLYHKINSIALDIIIVLYIFKFRNQMSFITYLYGVGSILLIYYYPDYKIKEKYKRRRNILNNSLPIFLTKVSLLMGSNISSVAAIKKVSQSRKNIFDEIVYKSILKIESGISLKDSFYELSNQCSDFYVTQFIRVIIQNEKYGSDFTKRLDDICSEVWKNKKVDVLKKGEEASTKLLIPMMISLISILIAVTVPAISQLFMII